MQETTSIDCVPRQTMPARVREAANTDSVILCRRAADREFVRSLKGFASLRVVGMTALLWAQLVIAWSVALLAPWWAVLPAAVVIIVCQQVLLLWVHEGSHHSLFPSKALNDAWVDLFFATPIGVNIRTYRANHLGHHNHLGSDDDPDRWNFAFVVKGWRGAGQLLAVVLGWYGLKLAWQKYGAAFLVGRKAYGEKSQMIPLLMAIGWNAGLLTACFFAGRWWLYPALWVYPALSVTILLNIIRTTAEHQPAAYDGNRDMLWNPPVTRTTIPSPLEKWMLYQTNFNLHVEHHAFPYVPFFNLPKLHRHLVERGFYQEHPQFLQHTALAAFVRA